MTNKPTADSPRIERVTLHRIDVDVPRHFSFGTWWNRQHLLLQITSAGESGWSEFIGSINHPDLDLAQLGQHFSWLRGHSPQQAFDQAARVDIRGDYREATELALIDLIGKIRSESSLTFLHLSGRDPIAGMPSLLSEDPKAIEAGAMRALEKNFLTHLKVKLFGKLDVDLAVIRAARSVIGPSAFLTGDANGGYGSPTSDEELAAIAAALLELRDAGLSAAEDPAAMDNQGWNALQEAVGDFPLIADEPLRPAREAIPRLNFRIVRICNLHPACMWSIPNAILLGEAIRRHGGKVIIGDNSLIGPACSQWQQLAIGLGAQWVEALEKPEESPADRYLVSKPTARLADGRIGLTCAAPGFGIDIDENELRQMRVDHIEL